MKKEKKQKKSHYKEVVLGNKIRDVKINERQHFLLFIATLIFFNLLLIISVWFVLSYLNNWYNWIICFAIIGLCFWLSLKTYRDIKSFHKCELYDNAISINSIWFNFKVAFKDICEINVKESVLDKILKLKTKSLEVKIMDNKRTKFTIHFVEENALKLKHEITMLIDKNTSKEMLEKTENMQDDNQKTSAN